MRQWIWMVLAATFMVAGCADKFTTNIRTKVSSGAHVTAEDCQCDCELERSLNQ